MTTGTDAQIVVAPAAGDAAPAPATPPKVELPEAPGAEDQPAAPAAEPTPEPEPPSLEDQVKTLTERVEKAEHRANSAEGRLKAGTTPEMANVATEIKRLGREIRRGEINQLPEEQRPAQLDQLAVAEQEANQEASYAAYATRMAGRINRRLAVAGVGQDDERVVNILTKWGQAKTEDQVDDVVDLVDELVDTITQERITAAAPKAPVPQNTSVPRGGPAQTDQAWLDAYGDETDTTIPSNPDNAAKAKQLMAKGLSPKPR